MGLFAAVVAFIVTVVAFVVAFLLIRPILSPTIIAFPWKKTESKEKITVILAGSYNPPHLGHLAMLNYLAER
jgi:ABC-type molybdate transport system substrate-binding protein